mmetsp:Transcript_102801/g.257912  ORF Transcript_102801/g.257912 Transcript_102801/m.257912 type:complete len:604 (+) Transcript_102801:60-1871(+)|eukprot:CAMPEP_0115734304 /NCGR_PEP_ID=MMETSP0272-20121206/86118_1 /TAXON_ID=71861 /ORGANISM="Scrippsiella trochoidea, Strain CCMP3099" /LENGTH=603 /DNA_ID=CAMNT_0003178341 /DNA_START=17 /DNA_END=1828 /DNA_ORIENTATION=-
MRSHHSGLSIWTPTSPKPGRGRDADPVLPSKSNMQVADLLQQVLAEHEREVAELRGEIRRLSESQVHASALSNDVGSELRHYAPRGGEGEAVLREPWQEQLGDRYPQKPSFSLRLEAGDKLEIPSGDGRAQVPGDGIESQFSDSAPEASNDMQQAHPEEVAMEAVVPSGETKRSVGSRTTTFQREEEEEDERTARLRRVIDGPVERMSSVVIMLNIIFLFVQLQHDGYWLGVAEGYTFAGQWADMSQELDAIEHAFNAVFLIELLARMAVLRRRFFYTRSGIDRFNVFDFVLVGAATIDLWVVQPLSNSGGLNIGIFRPLRCLRLLRALRVLQGLKMFMALRVLVMTIAASFMALFWSILLLILIMMMAALLLCQLLNSSIDDPGIEDEWRGWIYTRYGTSLRSLYTVFEFTFSGSWPNYSRPLVENVHPLYAVFFFVYIVAVVFAIFRIISALFLRDTLALAAADAEVAIQDKMMQKEAYAAKLLDFFLAADVSGDGFLTAEEFDDMLKDPKVKTWFSIMEVDVHETEEFFQLLADDQGLVSAQDFVKSIPRLKGQARSQDVIAVRFKSQKISHNLDDLRKAVCSINEAVTDLRMLHNECAI